MAYVIVAVLALLVVGILLHRRRQRIASETLGQVPPPPGLDASSRNRTRAP
jgi:hypothetical protein